jgi:hypothetical protein
MPFFAFRGGNEFKDLFAGYLFVYFPRYRQINEAYLTHLLLICHRIK